MVLLPDGSEPSEGIVLSAHGLTKVFESGPVTVKAVDGVDLTVRRGEIVLIVGPSGAGKIVRLGWAAGCGKRGRRDRGGLHEDGR